VGLAVLVLAAVLLDDDNRSTIGCLAVNGHLRSLAKRALGAAEEGDEISVRKVTWRLVIVNFPLLLLPLTLPAWRS
jgi:hypothetical protein